MRVRAGGSSSAKRTQRVLVDAVLRSDAVDAPISGFCLPKYRRSRRNVKSSTSVPGLGDRGAGGVSLLYLLLLITYV